MSDVGTPKQGLMNIGDEAKPPFAVLPNPQTLFKSRALRFRELAIGHELAPYLQFLARLTTAQHDAISNLPDTAMPLPASAKTALDHAMPPLHGAAGAADAIRAVLNRLGDTDLPVATKDAVVAVGSMDTPALEALASSALDSPPGEDIARRALVLAGLQVHFVRQASRLDADSLKSIADGSCPACGSLPVASAVVGWPKAANTRFCTCSLCATMWNVVRVKCVLCSATGGISYHTVEGKPDTVKAETCDACKAYVKILYQVQDPMLDAVADDVATLGLDLLMAEEGFKRGGSNPYLLGY